MSLERAAIARIQADADARRHVNLMIIDAEGLRQRLDDSLKNACEILGALEIWNDNGELITPKP